MRIIGKFRTELGRDRRQHGQHPRVLLFAKQVNLQVEMVATFSDSGVVILTDQNKGRQENCLERNDEREKRKWKRVDVTNSRNNIDEQPAAKPDDVDPNKRHAAAEVCDRLRQSIRARALLARGRFKF